jgi:Alpha-L-arabinofuranosidase B, catalytic
MIPVLAPILRPIHYYGPGNIVPGATAWWGLRAYSSYTAGNNAVRLRRDSDQAESDFVTLRGSGNLDVASITTFKGAANLFVTTLYDQTGNGLHFTQATAAKQLPFNLSIIGSFPAIQFGSGLVLTQTGLSVAQPLMISEVTLNNQAATGNILAEEATNTQPVQWKPTVAESYMLGPAFNAPVTTATWYACQRTLNNTASEIYLNGTGTSGSLGSASSFGTSWRYGAFDSSGAVQPMAATSANVELGIWQGSAWTAAQKSVMNSRQRAYWGF